MRTPSTPTLIEFKVVPQHVQHIEYFSVLFLYSSSPGPQPFFFLSFSASLASSCTHSRPFHTGGTGNAVANAPYDELRINHPRHMLTYIFPRPPTPTFPFHFLLFPGAVLDTDHGNIVSRPIPVSIDGHKMLSGYWQHVSSLPIQMHKHAPPSLALALPTRTGTLLETPRAQAALAQK